MCRLYGCVVVPCRGGPLHTPVIQMSLTLTSVPFTTLCSLVWGEPLCSLEHFVLYLHLCRLLHVPRPLLGTSVHYCFPTPTPTCGQNHTTHTHTHTHTHSHTHTHMMHTHTHTTHTQAHHFLVTTWLVDIDVEVVQAVSPLAWGLGCKGIDDELWYPPFGVVLEKDCHPGGPRVLRVWPNDGSRLNGGSPDHKTGVIQSSPSCTDK